MKIRETEGRTEIFDPLRKKYITLTPEERVRQELIYYLNEIKKVPMHMMASERGLLVNNMPKRFDLVVFGSEGKPVLIGECKAPHISLNHDVLYQAAGYNLALRVKYLIITNGSDMYCIQVDHETKSTKYLDDIPDYSVMK